MAYHTATLVKIEGKDYILTFGGLNDNYAFGKFRKNFINKNICCLDLNTFKWTLQKISGLYSEMYGHSANLIDDVILIFGGKRIKYYNIL